MGLWSLESWFESRPRSHSSFSTLQSDLTQPFRVIFVLAATRAQAASRFSINTSRRARVTVRVLAETLRACGIIGAQRHVAPACYEGALGSSKPNLLGIAPRAGPSMARQYSQLASVSRDGEAFNRVTACAQVQLKTAVPQRHNWCNHSFAIALFSIVIRPWLLN